ncbi:MAG: DNA repair protein RecO C-terminal domain-containing protein [Bacteroidales bacterium]|nr:DNA repair protein RecO C-terminal domain-containing protein [Bacteroidales bacterium]
MKHATPLIVLGTTPTGERSLVVHSLSPQLGRRGFLADASKGRTLFLPLSLLDAEVVENPRSDLWRIRSVTAVEPLQGIRSNLYKNTMALFLSEVLFRLLREGDREDGLFAWCERGIRTLDALESDFSNFHLWFLLGLCGSLGFSPNMEDLAPFAGSQLKNVEALLQSGFSEAMLLPLSGRSRSEIADTLLRYLSYHAETTLNIRSLDVLSEVFACK